MGEMREGGQFLCSFCSRVLGPWLSLSPSACSQSGHRSYVTLRNVIIDIETTIEEAFNIRMRVSWLFLLCCTFDAASLA